MNNVIRYFIIFFLTLLSACTAKKDEDKTAEAKTYTCPMHPQIVQDKPGSCPICGMDLVLVSSAGDKTEVILSESQMELANVTVQPVTMQNIGNSLLLSGRLKADESQTEVVSTRVPGRLDKLLIKETGMPISKGQIIYEIYSEQLLTLQREFLLAREQVNLTSGKNYQSYLDAAKKKLWLYGMTEAQINDLASSKMVNSRIQVAAPTSGIITEVMVSEGQYVAEGTSIYRLEKLNWLWVEAELYPNEASLIKLNDPLIIHVSGFENQPIESKVIFLSPEYRQGSQIFVLRAAILNSSNQFVPGMQAEIVFEHSKKNALTLPVDAVIREEGSSHVYKKTGKGKFKAQMVTTGLENFDRVEIKEGLEEGDSVAVTGAYLLYSEIVLKKGVNPMAGHHHEGMKMTDHADESTQRKSGAEDKSFVVDQKFSLQLGEIVTSYLKVKDALVASDAKGAAAQIKVVDASLKKVDMTLLTVDAHTQWMDKLKKLERSIKLIEASLDIEIQRASFSQLTDALYAAIKTFQVTNLKAYYQFCPMAFDNKGAHWISKEEEINNPYFGEKMLRCGETKETFK